MVTLDPHGAPAPLAPSATEPAPPSGRACPKGFPSSAGAGESGRAGPFSLRRETGRPWGSVQGRWPACRRRAGESTGSRSIVALAALVVVLVLVQSAAVASASSAPVACGGTVACAASNLSQNVPPPLSGTVTNCTSASSCSFTFNDTAGTGWARASPPALSLQLPGEPLASYNLSYSTYTAKLTGTYTYWTVGTFVGTDANSGKVVYGTTNTNFTITCYGHSGRGGGCTYVDTTDNGTIVVTFTEAEQTTTTVSCAPNALPAGSSTVCTAWVNDTANSSATAAGNVSFFQAYGSTAGFGNGGNCTLSSGSCSVLYTVADDQLGTVPIGANFHGTPSFYPSSGRTSIYANSSGGGSSSTVLFVEAGLANGTPWSVSLGGLTLGSSNSTVAFVEQNGSYAFAVSSVPGYTLSPRSGNVTVAGDDQNVTVRFSGTAYPVTFRVTGLPAGKSWSVTLDNSTVTSSGAAIVCNVSNGTHAYLLRGPAGYRVTGLAPAGTFAVDGAAVNTSFTLTRAATYTVVFAERGLPRNTTWCVALVQALCTASPALRFTNLTPGNYSYTIAPMVGQVITARIANVAVPLTGSVTVTTHSVRVVLRYTFPYPVVFTETGLPSGTNWSVTVGGVTESSTSPTITFALGNGTHAYRIGAIVGYVRSASPTAARVLGGAAYVAVTFRP